jgi:hypothetical protein
LGCLLILTPCFYPSPLVAEQEKTDTPVERCTIRMDYSSVIQVAKRAAEAQGVTLKFYKVEDVSFEFIDRRWTVFFDAQPPSGFDQCFRVFVKDQTGESEFR